MLGSTIVCRSPWKEYMSGPSIVIKLYSIALKNVKTGRCFVKIGLLTSYPHPYLCF